MRAVHPGDDDADAAPGVAPGIESAGDVPSVTLEVDGEVFELRPDQHGSTIRGFLAEIDPTTGYLGAD